MPNAEWTWPGLGAGSAECTLTKKPTPVRTGLLSSIKVEKNILFPASSAGQALDRRSGGRRGGRWPYGSIYSRAI